MTPFVAGMILLAVAGLSPQPAGPQDPQPKPAAIRGRVLDATTGRPIAMARVRLSGTARSVPERFTRTNGKGQYEFSGLPPGRFIITAAKARFVTLQHGQQLPASAGKPIDVAAGDVLDAVDFSLPRASAIMGRIVDEFGDPVDRAWVEVMRSRYVEGRRRLATIAGASANDAGEYRIPGLQPGSYFVVAAEASEGSGRAMDADIGFHRVAYPGTTNIAEAREVEVVAGRDTTGIDVALVPAAVANVTGVVVGPNGQPLSGITVLAQAVATGPGAGLGAEARTRPDGRFAFPRMVPGRYELHARGKTDRFVGAVHPLTVTGDADIVVPVSPGGRMTGRVLLPDGAAIRPSEVRLGATPIGDTFIFGAGFGGPPKDDWTFDWDYLLGGRVVRAASLPPGWYLKSVQRGDEDMTDTRMLFKADEVIADVQIVLANDGATVRGTATADRGAPCDRCTVVLFADDAARWVYPSRFIHATAPDQNNAFTIESIAPERYLIAVFQDLEDGQAMEPEFLDRARRVASPLDLTTTRTATVQLKVVKP